MVQLTIKVTKEILERSKNCGNGDGLISQNCAIAMAVRDIFPEASVSSSFIATTYRLELPNIPLPEIAQDFIKKFDATASHEKPLLPELEFTIDIPDKIIERINIDEIRPLLVNHPTLTLIEA